MKHRNINASGENFEIMNSFPIKQILSTLILITAGSFLCAIAVNGILVPLGFLSGGFIGVAILVYDVFSVLEVGWIYLFINIPIYLFAWIYVGKRFFIYSIAGVLIFSTVITLVHPALAIQDKILAAILAGILSGAGGGIILRSLGSAGGLDILSVILMKRFSIQLGTTVLFFNLALLCLAALLFSLEAALYTLVFMYVSSKVLNIMVTGLSQRKSAFIISPRGEEIAKAIMSQFGRGVTLIEAEGGFSGREEKMLYTVFTFMELSRLKQIIREQDPNAFVVVNETLEVMGHGIGNQPHW